MPKQKAKHIFSLKGINFQNINLKYGFSSDFREEVVPENTTKIDKIIHEENITFLDETKRMRKCTVSMIDFSTSKKVSELKTYNCFWDHHPIPEGVRPIGVPIRYVSHRLTKNYHSEITKEFYSISENITEKELSEIKNKDSRFSLESRGYYETDGVFCSFNCCMAYIESIENRKNPLYRFSKTLLLKIFSDSDNFSGESKEEEEIMPAPHWRTLRCYGGTLEIEEFRKSFNNLLITDYGSILFVSLGRAYQHQIRF